MSSAIESGASLVGRLGGSLVGQLRSPVHPSGGGPASGWLAVTVLCNPGDIDPAALPGPLAEFGDRIDVRVQPAPGNKGMELAVRMRGHQSASGAASRLSGADPQAELRSALRQAKQLIEVGEVLAVDPVPHGKRTKSPGGALVDAWTKAASKGGAR